MIIDTSVLVSMTEANQNFSKVVRLVDERGIAVIMKNNKPRYIMLRFQDYENIQMEQRELLCDAIENVIAENLEALHELAK